MNQQKSWNSFWEKFKFEVHEDIKIIDQELSSVRWKKIEKRVVDRFSSFKGLKVIEIGSGRGEISVLMALAGADVTLLDYSETALERAKELFKTFGLKATFMKADIFKIRDFIVYRKMVNLFRPKVSKWPR